MANLGSGYAKVSLNRFVLVIYTGGVQNVLLNEHSRDNCNEPYINLRDSFERCGYRFEWEVARPLEDYNWIFFFDVNSTGYRKPTPLEASKRKIRNLIYGRPMDSVFQEATKKSLRDKLILFLSEPPSVCPGNYDLKFHRHFGHVFTWKSDLYGKGRYHQFYNPVTRLFKFVDDVPFSRKKLLADISGNKFSNHERELYSERRRTIQFFEMNYPNDFDLYGTGWNERPQRPPQKSIRDSIRTILTYTVRVGMSAPRKRQVDGHHYSSYRGEVRHKWDVLPHYKFTICYENMRGEKDYISQRLFDVIRCKSVPIYWGAPNVSEYVDEKVFINREDFRSNEDLAKHLTGMSEQEYDRFIEAGKRYLESDKFRLFLSENYVRIIFSALGIAG